MNSPQDDHTDEPGIIINPHDVAQIPANVTQEQLRHANNQENPADKFTIVALGGSAGSLEAFERFFLNMPPDTGMAFVVVTHLSPEQEGTLAHVLQQFTRMPVFEATDGMKVRPNQVYVIPPNKDMSLLHGTLLLFAPTQARGKRMPIDFFFQSLAKDSRERAVCIICSGMGSDGTIGLKMIMENFGMVMVQSPETAEYDSMPRSAIATEFVDYVLPAEQLPAKLLEYVNKPPTSRPQRESAESAAKPAHALQKIFLLIRAHTGHDFSFYKRNTVMRRIERRMNSHQIKDFTHYVRYLQENVSEVEALFKELLIGVTKFFRDAEAFESFKKCLLPLLRTKPEGSTVRVWTPGCSTGEEAYSVAITLLECLDMIVPDRYLKVQVFATDINSDGIEYARAGLYPDNITADVSPERLQRYFTKVEGGYQIRKDVRDLVVFAPHNINKDAPFTKLDVLVCRNLLIYLSSELQRNLLPVFHYSLNPGGILFLGPSENLTGFQDLFAPLDIKWKISRRLEGAATLPRLINFPSGLSLPSTHSTPVTNSIASQARKDGPFAILVQKALLRYFAPPAVVINPKGEIMYVNGRTGRYLEPAPGLSNLNIFEMVRGELRYELSGAIHQVNTNHKDVVVEDVKLATESGFQLLRLSVKYLAEPEHLQGLMLVSFEEQPTPRKVRTGKANVQGSEVGRDAVVAALEKELQYTKQRLQTTIEEMESSLEELKSTNEELQSANEELQSTNEEAMTNKEEMQSMNEELMTLNMQYVSRTEELSQAANDMKNLLDATEIATIFLNNDLVIKRFTPPVGRIFKLVPADVGRPITDFANTLRYDHLARDVQQVIDRLVSVEATIQATTGEWYAMRILPYRTLDNYINGAVITFNDVTKLKQLEEKLQASTSFAESIIETVREPMLVLNNELRILTISQAFAERYNLNIADAKNQLLAELNGGAWNVPALRTLLLNLVSETNEKFDEVPLEIKLPQLGTRQVLVYGRRLLNHGSQMDCLLLGVSEDTGKAPAQ
ncbi:PAS domain-containing protein [Hymenobacter sp. BT188]|uniref:CheR family methyltransferase n=1 Tax=Hymenobacter sp. BT188 TaxID=2763504 RepID=UPI0016515CCC|nr:CheR family methyltransferase [Hymenobacter sp. BT188]MBC6605548.1 PAS domain-containing protein [Hymenobacter sp. BT188]